MEFNTLSNSLGVRISYTKRDTVLNNCGPDWSRSAIEDALLGRMWTVTRWMWTAPNQRKTAPDGHQECLSSTPLHKIRVFLKAGRSGGCLRLLCEKAAGLVREFHMTKFTSHKSHGLSSFVIVLVGIWVTNTTRYMFPPFSISAISAGIRRPKKFSPFYGVFQPGFLVIRCVELFIELFSLSAVFRPVPCKSVQRHDTFGQGTVPY
jgi:hypothetical protein